MKRYLASHADVLAHDSLTGMKQMAVTLPEGPLLLASRPIIHCDNTGPIRGAVLMGRFLGAEEVQQLAKTTKLNIAAWSLDDANAPADFASVRSSLVGPNATAVKILDDTHIASYVLYADPSGKSGVALQVNGPRDIHKESEKAVAAFGGSLAIIGVAVLACITLVLRRMSEPLIRSIGYWRTPLTRLERRPAKRRRSAKRCRPERPPRLMRWLAPLKQRAS